MKSTTVNPLLTLFGALWLLLLSACTTSGPETPQTQIASADAQPASETQWQLSAAQAETVGLKLGKPSQIKVNGFVSCTGVLGLPPNAQTSVHSPSAGFIRKARKLVEGDFISKGTLIAEVEHIELVDLQRQFLETSAELDYLQSELKRQESLLSAEAGIQKQVDLLRSQVLAKTALIRASKERLVYLGLDPASLSTGKISTSISLRAPASGYITSVALHDGMYVEPNVTLLEIIDLEHIHVELKVFESDLDQVKVGQRISYTVPSMNGRQYEAEVHVIGKAFDAASKTVMVHAHPVGAHPAFIRDLYVEAKIWLSDSSSMAVPVDAIISEGQEHFVFVPLDMGLGAKTDGGAAAAFSFRKVALKPGAEDGAFQAVSFMEPWPETQQLVTEGAYYIWAQSQKDEGEH